MERQTQEERFANKLGDHFAMPRDSQKGQDSTTPQTGGESIITM